jgi:predicted nucleic acid-binding protein
VNCYFFELTAFFRLFVKEPGTDAMIRLVESLEDNRKLIAASTPLEVYAGIRKRERTGSINSIDASRSLDILRTEAARIVQQPLNPSVLDTAKQVLDRAQVHWLDAVQIAAAMVAREMFEGTEIIFVSASASILEAARNEGFQTMNPVEDESAQAD